MLMIAKGKRLIFIDNIVKEADKRRVKRYLTDFWKAHKYVDVTFLEGNISKIIDDARCGLLMIMVEKDTILEAIIL